MSNELEKRQGAADTVEKKMLEMLLNFSPAEPLTVADVKTIARFARYISFDAFDPNKP